MQKPITSRVKRSPLLKYSPAKQTGNGNVEAIGSQITEGEDITTITGGGTGSTEGLPSSKEEFKNPKVPGQTWEEFTSAECGSPGKPFGSGMCKDVDPPESTTKKGEGKTVDAKLYRKDYQDVKEPWEVRRSNRAAKVQGRAQRRAQNKSDKVARQLAKLSDDERKPGNKKYDRLMAKQTETTQELENMKTGSENVAEGRRSGRLAGTTVRRTKDKVKTAGDYEDPDQIKQAARRQEIAAASNMTTSQAAGAVEANQTPFSGMMDTAKELGKLDYEVGQYTTGMPMKPSAFKMKAKSPAAKKLQGAQNTLPQHLQAAIKAAPGKMRSGFKMKGYGKK